MTRSTIKMGQARRSIQIKTGRTIMSRKTRKIIMAGMKRIPRVKSELGQLSHWQSDMSWIINIGLSVVSPKPNR